MVSDRKNDFQFDFKAKQQQRQFQQQFQQVQNHNGQQIQMQNQTQVKVFNQNYVRQQNQQQIQPQIQPKKIIQNQPIREMQRPVEQAKTFLQQENGKISKQQLFMQKLRQTNQTENKQINQFDSIKNDAKINQFDNIPKNTQINQNDNQQENKQIMQQVNQLKQVEQNSTEHKSLLQAFAELQQAKTDYELQNANKPKTKRNNTKKRSYDVYYTGSIKKKNKAINQDRLSFKQWLQYIVNKFRYDKKQIKRFAFITTGAFAVCITLISTTSIFARYQKEEEIKQKIATNVFETNNNALNVEKIIIKNVGVTKSKSIIEDEEREIDFETIREENAKLPKGEEVVSQEGVKGKKLVDCIKSYEDNDFLEENILDEQVVLQPVTEIIQVGTSEFLDKFQVRLGDKMYVTKNVALKKEADENAENHCIILESLDVQLLELDETEKWCKVQYGSCEGYVLAEDLTSDIITPGIGEKNRTQKINATLDANMDLTKPSGLTLEDFKKVLSGNPADIYKIIENNAEAFYNAEQKYKVNGIFLASIAIHESAWGTSQIAKDKHNLFGFGAYDRSPYESANTFEDYAKGIDDVARYLAINYLNIAGVEIIPGINATATYYNGPTIAGVNTRYCTDKEWCNKIFKYMTYLYNRL